MTTLLCRNETNADFEWSGYALKNLHTIKIYSYNNLNNLIFIKSLKGPSTNTSVPLHDQEYKNYLMRACNTINVDYPDEKDSSFKRDYYLIRDTDSIYFSGYFDTSTKARLQIKGREAWLVEMFVNKIIEQRKLEIQTSEKIKETPKTYKSLLPVYMFSENLKCWCQLNLKTLKWIYIKYAPKPIGNYLAFGSDPISTTARLEISIL
jgi:hypothetical protein